MLVYPSSMPASNRALVVLSDIPPPHGHGQPVAASLGR